MTTREKLNRIRRRGLLIAVAGFALLAISLPASDHFRPLMVLVDSGAVVVFGAFLYMIVAGRCPNCGWCLGRIVTQGDLSSSPLDIPNGEKACPHCGKSLDEPEA